jgi:hypothetical protein
MHDTTFITISNMVPLNARFTNPEHLPRVVTAKKSFVIAKCPMVVQKFPNRKALIYTLPFPTFQVLALKR